MGQVSREFYARVLTAIHAPVSDHNMHLLEAWQHVEGGKAAFNPFNTTQEAPGATDYNDVHVRNYPDEATGVHATVVTLQYHPYAEIVWALQHEQAHTFGQAVDSSPWGTHGLAEYLDGNPAPEPGHGTTTGEDDIVAQLPMLAHGAGFHAHNGNPHVRVVQGLLNVAGYGVHIDGKFGDSTTEDVRDFQAKADIDVDGVVGPQTYGKLLHVS